MSKHYAFCFVGLCTFLGACQPPQAERAVSPAMASREAEAAKAAEAERVAFIEDCKSNLEAKTTEYHKLMASRDYWSATLAIRRCSELLDDAQLKRLVADGEVKSYIQDVESKAPDHERLRSLETLIRDYPQHAKKYEKLQKKLAEGAERSRIENAARNRFARTPKVGESTEDVVQHGWGRPSHVNRTTTASGSREQWVYGDGRYLYFDNGILIAIQD